MIFGIGTDIVEIDRIEKLLDRDTAFRKKVFTEKESDYCLSKKRYAESFAARFAAKEAFFKALGTGWRGEMKFAEIEVLNDTLGKPELVLHGKVKEYVMSKSVSKLNISLSHTKNTAIAFVILEI